MGKVIKSTLKKKKKKKEDCKGYLILYEIVGSPPCEGSMDGIYIYSASQTQGRHFWKAKTFLG